MIMRRRQFITALALLGAAGKLVAQSAPPARGPDVIFVPTPNDVVEQMLELAAVTRDDIVYDLGCGDGRIPIIAAQKYGARGVGIDIDPQRIRESRENARNANVEGRVRFIEADLFQAEIGEATVVTLFLLTSLNAKLRPKLLKELRPGTRVVSHGFDMGDWAPEKRVFTGATSVYLWRIPG
jgi:SAM-dependent methyltransferase